MYLAEMLIATEQDSSFLGEAVLVEGDPLPYYRFQEDSPGPDGEALDRVAVEVVQAAAGARGLWRAWRTAPDGNPWPLPEQVFVAEIAADADPVALTRELHHRLAAEGDIHPRVEVLLTGDPAYGYQNSARANGELLWAAQAEHEMRVASLFDGIDEEGNGRFDEDHPRLEDAEERERVLGYLRDGEILMFTPARLDDVIDPARTFAVPLNFRTDGTWVWNDVHRYYLEEHHIAPEADLLAHIRSAGDMPEVDGVALFRAMKALGVSTDEDEDEMAGAEEPEFAAAE
jgi:hypothetical protein